MVLTPDVMAAEYVEAGCQRLIVHAEACTHLHRTLGNIASLGATAGVALNPATPADAVAHVLDLVDLVLVMTVNPGFGGQQYIATDGTEDRRGCGDDPQRAGRVDDIDVEVDGGIGPDTVAGRGGSRCQRAGRRQRPLPRSARARTRRRRPARRATAART